MEWGVEWNLYLWFKNISRILSNNVILKKWNKMNKRLKSVLLSLKMVRREVSEPQACPGGPSLRETNNIDKGCRVCNPLALDQTLTLQLFSCVIFCTLLNLSVPFLEKKKEKKNGNTDITSLTGSWWALYFANITECIKNKACHVWSAL